MQKKHLVHNFHTIKSILNYCKSNKQRGGINNFHTIKSILNWNFDT